MNTWLKLYRSILDSDVFQNANLLKVWVWCLCKASHKDRDALVGLKLVPIKSGQFVFGRKVAAEELHMSESSVYRYMTTLQKMGNLSICANNKYSIVTIEKWGDYQCGKLQSEQQDGQQMNNKRTTNEQQMDTDKNIKNVKELKNDSYYQESLKRREDIHRKSQQTLLEMQMKGEL